jgi:hypothetical protein
MGASGIRDILPDSGLYDARPRLRLDKKRELARDTEVTLTSRGILSTHASD